MFEKVTPSHPDKIMDRIAGAIVDLAYRYQKSPKIAVEGLIGHGECTIITESSVRFKRHEIEDIVHRIAGNQIRVVIYQNLQNHKLADNQKKKIRCGDNGIFKGVPMTEEEKKLTQIMKELYEKYGSDGKCILDRDKLVICQSCAKTAEIKKMYPNAIINPIGEWTGGTTVDSGAINRKLGSDMGNSVTGGGLHGKDLSKADVSVNIYAFLKAQETGKTVEISCAIGDETIDGMAYEDFVKIADEYIQSIGGFEKFAEWGLIS